LAHLQAALKLVSDIKAVKRNKQAVEKEISIEQDKSYMMHVATYLRENKGVDGVVISFVNITEIKKLNSFLEAVANSSTNGIVAMKAIRDEKGGIKDFEYISANEAANKMLAIDDMVRHTYNELNSHVDMAVFEDYTQVVTTGETTFFEFYNTKTGRWFEIVAVKMMDGLVLTFNDVNDKKTLAEKIAHSYNELKETTSQLQAVNYKLDQSNLDLLQFAAVASHDLKEPLRKVQAFGNLLRERTADKMDKVETNYLDKMINSSNRMQVLIDDILTLSRLSNYDTPHTEINVNSVVNEILEDLEINIRERTAKIQVQKLPLIHGVPGQVRQLLQNLIANAIKFNEGRPQIEIGSEAITPEMAAQYNIKAKDYAAIYVQDNGIGFDEAYSDKIFGIFQRLEQSTFQGTGIGLAIVKKIVDNHKGFIQAQSNPGEGARFVILLPK
jgi:two-component system CheB/CheR fusion protein